MISNVSLKIRKILESDRAVFKVEEAVTEDKILALISDDSMKAVGYQLVPVKYDATKNSFIHRVNLYILDISGEEGVSAIVDSSIAVAVNVFKSLSESYGDISFDSKYIRENSIDKIGFSLVASFNVLL